MEAKMKKFYQIGMDGRSPQGPLFESVADAEREIMFQLRDDRRSADEAMREAGYEYRIPTYQVHEVLK